MYKRQTVRRHLPDGTPDRILRLPACRPAGVCLEGDVLHITTARLGLNPPGPYDGAVFSVRVEVPGSPAAPYRPAASVVPTATAVARGEASGRGPA